MRLTTLARKVGRTPSQLITFLESAQVEITNGANTKLDEAAIALVLKEYEIELEKPEASEVELPKEPEHIIEEVPVTIEESPAAPVVEISKPEPLPIVTPSKTRSGTVDDLEDGDHSAIDHIKAKKVKLEGFKVVGKIELPQKPVKTQVAEETNTTSEETETPVPERPAKKQRSDYKKYDRHPKHDRKPLSYEERLKREEQAKKREIQQKLEEDKARKQRYYEKNIAPKAPVKSSKKKAQKANAPLISKQPKVVSSNPFQRFWAWINGQYDKY